MEVLYSSTDDSSESDSDSHRVGTLDLSNKQLSLETLHIEIECLDKTLNNNNTVKTLMLHNNQLSGLPVIRISQFHNLNVLNVSQNHLTSLPIELLQCPLTRLIARNNKLYVYI